MQREVSKLNPANAITASRYFTLPPFVWGVATANLQLAALALIVCGLFDKLDGRFAVWFNCKSQFGELFDAITDGICYGLCLLMVIIYEYAPLIPGSLVLVFGAINSGLRFVYAKRAGRNINYKSVAMERLVAYTAFLIAFALANYEVVYFYWAFVAAMAVVLLHDAKRMLIDPIPPAEQPALAGKVAA